MFTALVDQCLIGGNLPIFRAVNLFSYFTVLNNTLRGVLRTLAPSGRSGGTPGVDRPAACKRRSLEVCPMWMVAHHGRSHERLSAIDRERSRSYREASPVVLARANVVPQTTTNSWNIPRV
jgi:hypothetical protein